MIDPAWLRQVPGCEHGQAPRRCLRLGSGTAHAVWRYDDATKNQTACATPPASETALDLYDKQWDLLKSSLTQRPAADGLPLKETRREGRPPSETRLVVNAVLWYVRTGGPWRDLPQRYGSYQTAARHFRTLRADGRLHVMFQKLEEDVRFRAQIGDVGIQDVLVDPSDRSLSTAMWATLDLLQRAQRAGLYSGFEPS